MYMYMYTEGRRGLDAAINRVLDLLLYMYMCMAMLLRGLHPVMLLL